MTNIAMVQEVLAALARCDKNRPNSIQCRAARKARYEVVLEQFVQAGIIARFVVDVEKMNTLTTRQEGRQFDHIELESPSEGARDVWVSPAGDVSWIAWIAVELKLVPTMDALDLPPEVTAELVDEEIDTHYSSSLDEFRWSDDEHLPLFKAWALAKYGEGLREYDHFGLHAT